MSHSFTYRSVRSFAEHFPQLGAELGAKTSSVRLICKKMGLVCKPRIAPEAAPEAALDCGRREDGMVTAGAQARPPRSECHWVQRMSVKRREWGGRATPHLCSPGPILCPTPVSRRGLRSCPVSSVETLGQSLGSASGELPLSWPAEIHRHPCVENMFDSQVPSP